MEEHLTAKKRKWNHIFWESLKMAALLPVLVLFIEYVYSGMSRAFFADLSALAADFVFMFSVVFLVFVAYHVLLWKNTSQNGE
ncbi:hypothetical protein QLX67_03030 [Balneolaceae bacterium ANBcel3]|nr:hypothetical protein [Balneolaceae bacterium ANBcel3]